MKKRQWIWMLLVVAFSASLFASPRITQQPTSTKSQEKTTDPIQELAGSNTLGAHTFDKITSSGLLKLNGTTITQTLRVEGSLVAQSAHLNTVDITGEATIGHSIISNASTIVGSIRAQDTTFQGPLTLATQKATFSSSKLTSITVRKDLACKGKQIIELKQRTLVDGPISFESSKGEVHVYPGSQVLGKVSGGKIVRKG